MRRLRPALLLTVALLVLSSLLHGAAAQSPPPNALLGYVTRVVEHVEHAQFSLGGLIHVAPVCRNHADEAPGSGNEPGRLRGTYAAEAIVREVLRSREEIAPLDVGKDDSLATRHRETAGAHVVQPNTFPILRRLGNQAFVSQQQELVAFGDEHLKAR